MRTVAPPPRRASGRALAAALLAATTLATPARAQRVEISLAPSLAAQPVTGRVFFFLTRTNTLEPRLQAGSYNGSVPFFGLDVSALKAGQPAVIDAGVLGFPLKSLRDIPAGDYYVQGLLNVYTQFKSAPMGTRSGRTWTSGRDSSSTARPAT